MEFGRFKEVSETRAHVSAVRIIWILVDFNCTRRPSVVRFFFFFLFSSKVERPLRNRSSCSVIAEEKQIAVFTARRHF